MTAMITVCLFWYSSLELLSLLDDRRKNSGAEACLGRAIQPRSMGLVRSPVWGLDNWLLETVLSLEMDRRQIELRMSTDISVVLAAAVAECWRWECRVVRSNAFSVSQNLG